jgi:CHAT domain-containing protein
MKKNILLFLVFLPFTVFSQQWHAYSDSIISNINKNEFEKAINFELLADNEIANSNVVKDTLYANYLYAKGVLYTFDETKNGIDFLNKSLSIWNNTEKKNYYKIMKIHYFLAKNFSNKAKKTDNNSDYLMCFNSYENCYSINKKYHLKSNPNFFNSLYNLILISDVIKDNSKLKKFSDEFIADFENELIENIDFKLVTVYRLNKNLIGQEKLLQKFLLKYENEKLEQPLLLYNIYANLVDNNLSQKDVYGNFKYPEDIIKYGEKAFNLFEYNKLPVDEYLPLILMALHVTYLEFQDNINSEKYEQLLEKYYTPKEVDKKYEDLQKLLKKEDYKNFKIKFDEFENELKSKNDYKRLSDMYGKALYLYEKNEIFSKDDVFEKLNFIILHKSELTKKEQIDFDCTLVEFYSHAHINLEEALLICDNNLDVQDINVKLFFYRFKSTIENSLNLPQYSKTAYKALEIAKEVFGENDSRILTYYSEILALNNLGNDINATEIASKCLKIIYDNKLEKTEIAAIILYYLGNEAERNGNYIDFYRYMNECKSICENLESPRSDSYYYLSTLELIEYDIKEGDFDSANDMLKIIKSFIDGGGLDGINMKEHYYWTMIDFHYYQSQFSEAKEYIEKCLLLGNENRIALIFKNLICQYEIEKDALKSIKALEKFDKVNKTDFGYEYEYILYYNLGDLESSKKIIIDILEKIINENNKYFHLLSEYEKKSLFNSFSDYFEFLNTYLLNNNSDFIKKYVDYRFYSKSILFSNSFKMEDINDQMVRLYNELKSNKIQINKNVEQKIEDSKETDDLKYRNREIEKLLSLNTKSLKPFTKKKLNNILKNNEAYIEIIRINKQSRKAIISPKFKNQFTDSIYYGAIVIKKNKSPKFILIDGSSKLEKQFASSFKTKIQNKVEDVEGYHLLFEKIDDELKHIEKIYIVTDGVYNSINIESIYNPSRKQYLIDYLKIQSIQNVRAITDEKNEFKVGSNTKTILFGNPDFDLLITDAKTDYVSSERGLDNNVLDKIKSSIKIGRLDGTQKEIETLNGIFKNSKSNVELFSKANATEDNLKNIHSPDILHIATHGYFLSNNDTSKAKQSIANLFDENYKNDSYLKSGLLLAGAQNTLNGKQPENSNNGILTAEEAKSLNLKDTELVVLSACETGLGDNLVGEGVIGLQRAFMIAGAKSVIMSLWSVSDEKTQELMTMFYTNWIKNNMTKEEALYQAKIEMKKLYPQPYYWAGFVLLE